MRHFADGSLYRQSTFIGFTSKMAKLHTVAFESLKRGKLYVDAKIVTDVMAKGPPSLRRISVNGIMWEVGNFIVCSVQLLYGLLIIDRDHGYRT
jgi:hypothetical protein